MKILLTGKYYLGYMLTSLTLDNELNKVIPKHLEQEIKNNFDWYIRAACVNTVQ